MSNEKIKKRSKSVVSKMCEYEIDPSLCSFFLDKMNFKNIGSWGENTGTAILTDFERKLASGDPKKIAAVSKFLRWRLWASRVWNTIGIAIFVLIVIGAAEFDRKSATKEQSLALADEKTQIIIKKAVSKPILIPSKLSQKPFSVEGIEIYDILNSENGKWKKAEVYVYVEHLTSGERRVFILTCKEKGIVSKFRDNLRLDTLVALSNFDKAIKGRVVTWLGRDYQEYYLDSVSDIAVVRERGDALDEMWSVDVETGLE